MFKEDTSAIHPEAVFNEDNNNNKKLYLQFLTWFVIAYCVVIFPTRAAI